MAKLTHLDEQGAAHMVDVSEKNHSVREARAQAQLRMSTDTLALIDSGEIKKGDVFAAARIAGIQAAKKTSDLIPLCHPLMLTAVSVNFDIDEKQGCLYINTHCKLSGKTGVEMEALTAASVAALTIYDMCKALDKGIVIAEIRLLEKTGGKSGAWYANGCGAQDAQS